jgi:hypothetical protein
VQGLGPRFALEVAFLIALAIGAGVAELSAAAIVVVMTIAWLLICLFELAVWAEGPRFPLLRRRAVAEQEEEPAAVTEIREPEAPARRRFWRRNRAASGGEA